MEIKPCIIVLTHPNTENKKLLLVETLNRLNELSLPIFVFANMDVDSEFLPHITEFIYTGQNPFYSASDFLSIDEVIKARNETKYRNHVQYLNQTYTYTPITYGNEKSYFWACNMLYQVAFNHVKNLGYTHFMLSQYDTLIPKEELFLVHEYFGEMFIKNLDGYFAVDPNMGENHFNGDVFWGNVKWWSDMFNTMSPWEFYNLTFPNWTPEEYFYIKAFKKGGNVKILLREEGDEWEKNFYQDLPPTWEKELIKTSSRKAVNTFFPSLSDTGLSNYWDTPNFEIEKSMVISCVKKPEHFEIFVWNKPISENDRNIQIEISFSVDKKRNPINLNLEPGYWSIHHQILDSDERKLIVNYSYQEDTQIINGNKEYYIQ